MTNFFFEEYYLLAKQNFEKKNYKKAKENLLKCIDLKNSLELLNFLGTVYMHLKEYENAIKIFEKLLDSNYSNDSVYNNLGIALKNKKNYLSALKQFKLSLELNPKNHLSFFNLGNIYLELNENSKAEMNFKNCLKINKKYTPALLNLSTLYFNKKELEKSQSLLKKCIELKNYSLPVLENISKIYLLKRNFSKAEIFIKRIIENSPKLLNKIIPIALGYVYQGKSKKYKEVCKFYNSQLDYHKSFNKFNHKKSNHPINLGFIGPDFRTHPVGFFLKDMLPELNQKLNLNIFSTLNYQDEISDFMKKHSNWIQCDKLDTDLLAELIYKKKIDVLVDTSGMTRTNKLDVFKQKPAKIQISWAGWLTSTHMKEIDYIVGDNFATPKKDEKNFSEKVFRIGNIWCTYSNSTLDDLGLKKKLNNSEEVVYGCFQRPEKINDEVLKVWSNILLKVKKSKIYFINNSIGHYEKKKITDFLVKNGVYISRIFFIAPPSRKVYLNYFNFVDINLDTFPYNGGTTSFESSYMNTPTLTMINNSCMFRCGESINKNLKMNEWIAKNKEDYINKGVFFSNKNFLNSVKKKLHSFNKNSALFNSKKFSKEFISMIFKIAN